MSWSRALLVAFIAVFGLTACVFDLSGDKPAKAQRPDYLPPRDEANWAKMQAFLGDYKKKEGVTALDNGIMYRWVHKGPGLGPQGNRALAREVRYKGTPGRGQGLRGDKGGRPAGRIRAQRPGQGLAGGRAPDARRRQDRGRLPAGIRLRPRRQRLDR